MKRGDLVTDGENRLGVITTIILTYVPVEGSIVQDGASVAMVYYFKDQKEEVVYADEITVIKKGEDDGKHILERL